MARALQGAAAALMVPTPVHWRCSTRHDTDSVSAPPINGPIARKIWLIPA